MDYSMGSSLFAVKPPIANQLWEDNNPVLSDSPYVVSYIENRRRSNVGDS